MADQKIPTAGAQALANKADEALERIRQNFTRAQTPDPAWLLYNPLEIEKRLQEQKDKALALNKGDLDRIKKEVEGAIENGRQKLNEKLRPRLFSSLPSEQEAGRYWEERAHRVMRQNGFPGIEVEYRWAMENKFIDYGSELLSWGDSEFLTSELDEVEIEQRRELGALKQEHLATLGLLEVLADRDFLTGKLRDLDLRGKMLQAAPAKTGQEFIQQLRAAGV